MSINLHIERLVLDGLDFNATGREQLSGAVQRELTQLLTNQGLPSNVNRLNKQRTIQGGSIELGYRKQPNTIGQQIGRSILRGFDHGN